MNSFWKRKSPFWHVAFLFLLSFLLSWEMRQAAPTPALQQVAQQWLDDCLGSGRGRVELLQAEPLQMVATLHCTRPEAETVARGLHTLLATDPGLEERIVVVHGPPPRDWHSTAAWLQWLAAGGLGLAGIALLRKRPEWSWRGSGWGRALTLGGGLAFLGLAWQSVPYRLAFTSCALLCFYWSRLQGRREVVASGLTPGQEAAVLLMSLPPEVSAGVFKELGPDDVHRVTVEISRLPSISSEVRQRVLDRFLALSSLDLRKSAPQKLVSRALSRLYLGSGHQASPLWVSSPVRWSALALHLLSALALVGWLLGAQRWLPSQRPPLQEDLGRFLGSPVKVVQFERRPGVMGVVVSLPGAQVAEAETTLPLVRDRLAALGLPVERSLVVATRPTPVTEIPVLLGAVFVLFFVALGLLRVVERRWEAGRASAPPPDVVAAKPRRRRIFECSSCSEVFVDGESLGRHEQVCHPQPQQPVTETVRPASPPTPPPVSLPDLIRVDAVGLEFGRQLLGLVDPNRGARLLERATNIRRHLAAESGVVVPDIRFRDNLQLRPSQYVIKIRDLEVASGELQVNRFLAIGPEKRLRHLKGERTQDPTYGMPGVWIDPGQRGTAERLGCMLFDPVSVIATHLSEILRRHFTEIFTLSECKALLDSHPDLAVVREALERRDIDDVVLWKALQGLVRERVSIRDLEVILESFLDGPTDCPHLLGELARTRLSGWISKEWANSEGVIQVLTVEPAIELLLEEAVRPEGFLAMDPEKGQEILQAVAGPVQMLLERGLAPVILTSPPVRPALRRLIERSYPQVTVLSWIEIAPGYQVNSIEMICL